MASAVGMEDEMFECVCWKLTVTPSSQSSVVGGDRW